MLRKISLALLLIAWLGTCSSATGAETARIRRAPNFVLRDWQGHWVKLSDYRGKVIALEFMQTNCPECHTTTQGLRQLYEKYKEQGFAVILVSHDPGREKAIKPFAENYALNFPVLIGDLAIAVRYIGITPQHSSFAIPYLFLIDRRGYIVGEHVRDRDPGFLLDFKANLEKDLVRLLPQEAEPKQPVPASK